MGGKPVKIFDLVTRKIEVGDHAPIRQKMRRYSPKMLEIAHSELGKYLE